MSELTDRLPSWRPGPDPRRPRWRSSTRAGDVPVEHRVACFDNDGTLWCERPTYVQFDFFIDVLKQAVARDPSVAAARRSSRRCCPVTARRSTRSVCHGSRSRSPGCARGSRPRPSPRWSVTSWAAPGTRPSTGPTRATVYQPMLELLDVLRSLDFTVSVVTGGGTEFVRAVSDDLYGVPPERVVGTLLEYDVARPRRQPRRWSAPRGCSARSTRVRRRSATSRPSSDAARSSASATPAGDRQMLAWAAGGAGPTLALLLDHDDAEREFAYRSKAETFAETEPITDVAASPGLDGGQHGRRLGDGLPAARLTERRDESVRPRWPPRAGPRPRPCRTCTRRSGRRSRRRPAARARRPRAGRWRRRRRRARGRWSGPGSPRCC